MRRATIIACLLLLPLFAQAIGFSFAIRIITFGRLGSIPVPITYIVRPNQSAEISGLVALPARQKCENWTWAANLETLLARDHVALPQADWVTRTEGGEVCKDDGPDFETMSRVVTGDYNLDDGRKVHLDVSNVSGAPTVVDDLIAAMKQQHPLQLFWKGHGYILVGVRYDEYIAPTGARIFQVSELKLLDPFAEGEKQQVSFRRDTDDSNDIQGIMDVRVRENSGQSWTHPENEYTRNHQTPAERQLPPASPLQPVPPKTWTPGKEPANAPAK
jgi:hypothetical protein